MGNRRSSAEHPDWRYDDNNRLTSYNGTTYTHDENGNVVTRTDASGTTTYTYDSENKLTGIDFPGGGFVEYVYDGLGRRIEKNVNGTITRYVYDLEDILFEYDGSNTITARYTHGPGIDDPIAMERGGQSYFYHTDGLGSITGITDSSKQIVASYSYDAFGNIISQSGSLTNYYTFTSREYDPELGLYYYRARYFDPTIGRFLQPDRLDMAAVILIRQYLPGSAISRFLYQSALKNPLIISNVYPYVGNNPINWVDPWGLLGLPTPGFGWVRWRGRENVDPKLIPPDAPAYNEHQYEQVWRGYPEGRAIPGQWVALGFAPICLGGYAAGKSIWNTWNNLIDPVMNINKYGTPIIIIIAPVIQNTLPELIDPSPTEAAPICQGG